MRGLAPVGGWRYPGRRALLRVLRVAAQAVSTQKDSREPTPFRLIRGCVGVPEEGGRSAPPAALANATSRKQHTRFCLRACPGKHYVCMPREAQGQPPLGPPPERQVKGGYRRRQVECPRDTQTHDLYVCV